MKVSEIYLSLQGECRGQGAPCVFVRLHGCNLNCSYCDTKYAKNEGEYEELGIDEVANRVSELCNSGLVCITGGEPLMQRDELEKLILRLHDFIESPQIQIFTNGTMYSPTWMNKVDNWVVDVKCPNSGIVPRTSPSWLNTNFRNVNLKFTVSTEEDIEFARSYILRDPRDCFVSPVLMMGDHFPDDDLHINKESVRWMRRVANFCVETNAIYSLQWHKFIWGNERSK